MPQVSAVWSADPEQLWSFPASFLAEFFDNHGILALTGRPRWRTIVGGSRTYVEALIAPLRDRIRLRTPVRRIERHPDRVEIAFDGGSQSFDEVVIATHSDQALGMLADPSPLEREILGSFPYQRNETVLHTDQRLLPRRRRAWASWNFHLVDEPAGLTTVTYHMNRLQALSADREFCVTLNRTDAIDPAKVIRKIEYQHPVFTRAGRRRPAPPRRDQRSRPHPLLRRLLALGLSRGRRVERAPRLRAADAESVAAARSQPLEIAA